MIFKCYCILSDLKLQLLKNMFGRVQGLLQIGLRCRLKAYNKCLLQLCILILSTLLIVFVFSPDPDVLAHWICFYSEKFKNIWYITIKCWVLFPSSGQLWCNSLCIKNRGKNGGHTIPCSLLRVNILCKLYSYQLKNISAD